MNSKKLIKYQIYLTPELQDALGRYIAVNYPPGSRVYSIIFKKAMFKFLVEEGFLNKTIVSASTHTS